MSKGIWQRVSKARPCPVCGKPDWCVYVGPATAPEAVLCARVESPRRIGAAGWLHRLRESVTAWPPYERTIRRAVRMMSHPADGNIDFTKVAADFARAVRPEALKRLAVSLWVCTESLTRLGIGWSGQHRAWSFPMTDATEQVVAVVPSLRNRDEKCYR